jgi:hypothetical protein
MSNSMELKGKNIFIRTVTNFYTGRVVKETPKWLKLETAAWIADTGRFADALASSVFGEVEPYPRPVIVMKAAFVDVTEIGELPTKQK